MNILITGANNYIARDLINFFSEKKSNNIIATFKRKIKKIKKKNVLYKKLDLKKKFILNNKFDVLVHCASATPLRFYTKKDYTKINVQGFKKILKFCKNAKYIILLSSIAVYGKINAKLISEKTNLKGNTEYAKSKIKMENQLKIFGKKKKIRILILRLPGVIGATINKNNFLSEVISNIKKNTEFKFSNPDSLFNNLVTTKILYRIIKKFITRKNIKYIELYNCATTNPRRLIKIIFYVAKILKKKPKFKIIKSAKKYFNISTTKLLENRYPLKSTLSSLKEIL
jgi:nucleoside-diphosphate-sugar epimerase